jgi:hypothetical protein
MQIRELLRSQWLLKHGWSVVKVDNENAMYGMETLLTKSSYEMRIRWNDFPYLVTVVCTTTGETLIRRYIQYVGEFQTIAKTAFRKCPVVNYENNVPPDPSGFELLLYDEDGGLLQNNGDYIYL